MGSTLAADRAAFLQEVETIVGEQRRAEYERVLDDLIAWSESQGGRIEFRPRPQGNQQATVTYCFRGTPHLFWQVYPRPSRRDAKLTSVLDPRWLVPDPLRETLLRQFAELSGGQPDSPVLPTLSFNDLLTPTARQRLFVLLGDVLTTLSARLQTSPPGDSQPGNE